ncbi:uncharacterized protein A4U43_C07F14100 [Asparagus officinalis]|uniref:Uncharacterized protein n=1 Tax=Asparagus officinalis TaxID=4686 RepID=A0A5P1EBU0_ASPOF|nr:uncharacterized protein A4U43_C07F14100 [Asparagus officinalis]
MCGGAIISDFIAFKGARNVTQSDLWSSEFENLTDSFESNGSKPQTQQAEPEISSAESSSAALREQIENLESLLGLKHETAESSGVGGGVHVGLPSFDDLYGSM